MTKGQKVQKKVEGRTLGGFKGFLRSETIAEVAEAHGLPFDLNQTGA